MKNHNGSPAHILMSHAGHTHHGGGSHKMGHYATGGEVTTVEGKAKANAFGGPQGMPRMGNMGNRPFAEGGANAAEGGKMRRGGRRHHHAEGEAVPGGAEPSANTSMRRGGRRHHHAEGEAVPGGAEPSANTSMRRRGRRHHHGHHAHGDVTRNPHSGHPQYFWPLLLGGLAGSLLPSLLGGLGGGGGGRSRGDEEAAEGGRMRRGGRHHGHHAEGGHAGGGAMEEYGQVPRAMTHAEGGKMRRGGRRHHHADGGPSLADALVAQGVAPTMRRGGRRHHHAEGESAGLHRAIGGAGKTRKNYPFT